ncbi:putative alpha methylacyl-CoA racemase [Colletotrichum truncatum]|uniref:Alpha methylacyl-CoA racemase n=1 Tax=Colletotrichum truncatum TaxID=5467 RepID=A0ACC3YPE9_COLTU|nr:putative alpha methylacyl-CoA racemase [Colletotrichum truncatum]KAF6784243.1 putative alpha methylacyl-CoA racemase [Colletotrichum truncatum]
MGSLADYSVPQEAKAAFVTGILENPLMKDLPADLRSLAQHVKFEGSSKPSVPMNWKFAESTAALKALEATLLNRLLMKKYNAEPADVVINTDHATLFFMSPLVASLVGNDGKTTPMAMANFLPEAMRMFPNTDLHRCSAGLHRQLPTNIYKTKEGRCYQMHGGINPDPVLKALGMPADGEPIDTYDAVVERFAKVVAQHTLEDLDELLNDKHKQSGVIAWSSDEYFASEQGKACAKSGLYEITKAGSSSQPVSWWPSNQSLPSSPKRPLAGLKVVDLSRIIAGPAISRSLAELGASVMRVTSANVTDMSLLHHDLNWGKWNCNLDLKNEGDREKLRALIREADVVVDAYRPGVMQKHGFSRQDIFDLVKARERGIIHVRENCYGWHGPWQNRGGWQQISDACCGVSLAYGQAMGHDEAVTPPFPVADYCAGVCGSAGVLDALMRRAEQGGTYGVDVALNYYTQWLVRSCGTYPDAVWKELWERHGSPVFRHYHAMPYTVPAISKLLTQHDADILFQQQFFEKRESSAVNGTFVVVKPIAQFSNEVELKYNVGTRGNGVDQPVWPADLSVEVVKE